MSPSPTIKYNVHRSPRPFDLGRICGLNACAMQLSVLNGCLFHQSLRSPRLSREPAQHPSQALRAYLLQQRRYVSLHIVTVLLKILRDQHTVCTTHIFRVSLDRMIDVRLVSCSGLIVLLARLVKSRRVELL